MHGCADELRQLLDELRYTDSDRVFFVGDLVARGPDSSGVLRLFRELGAAGVLGNHEDRLLDARSARSQGKPGPRLSPAHQALLEGLSGPDWDLLQALPLTLDLPEHDVRIVHAGLVPGVPLALQKRQDLLKMRALEPDGTATSSWREESWATAYAERPHVVFGHNAVSGLQLHPHATGLDTGCVYGGRLTALVLPAGCPVADVSERTGQLVCVPARRRYVNFGPRFDGKPTA